MKKLYFLDEEEKNRILNIHEGATKRQYLLKEDALSDFEANLPKETKDKFTKMRLSWEGPATNEQGIVDALNTFTAAEYNLYNQYLALKKPEGVTTFEGMINAEMGKDDMDNITKVVDALKKLGVTASGTKLNINDFKEGSFKITSQPVNTSTQTFTDAATACIKQFSSDVKTSSTPGFVYTPLADGSNLFFGVNYSIQYQTKGKSTIYGNWSCKGNVLNIIRKDGLTWSKAQGGWKNPTDKAAVDPKVAYQQRAKQVNQKTIDTTKQIQQSLGQEPTGNLDATYVEKVIDLLKQ
jgi:hypothetical protein